MFYSNIYDYFFGGGYYDKYNSHILKVGFFSVMKRLLVLKVHPFRTLNVFLFIYK
jgi:hypothetical protein